MELVSLAEDIALEFLMVNARSRLDKKRGRWPPSSHDNTFFDEVTTGSPNVIFNSPTYLVS